jgi:hypothetical protein
VTSFFLEQSLREIVPIPGEGVWQSVQVNFWDLVSARA